MKLPALALIGAMLATPALADWSQTLEAARGQTVYWNAWGGDARTNDFIAWVGSQTEALYGVKVEQVKLTDTAEAVTRVIAEKAAGQNSGGTVDLIWINGPNFLAMKEQGLLHGPFVAGLPNAAYLDLGPTSPASVDFTTPVDGMESPWRLAKFVFPDASLLQAPVTDADFASATAPLWAWYDALRPNLWRNGKTFPENESVQQQLLNDGEVDISMSFDP